MLQFMASFVGDNGSKSDLLQRAINKYYHAVLHYCYLRLNYNMGAAEVCTQQVFETAWGKLDKIQYFDNIKAYFMRTADNMIKRHLTYITKEKDRTVLYNNDFTTGREAFYTEEEMLVNRISLRENIRKVKGQLNEKEKRLFELHFEQKISIKEISEINSESENVVSVHIHRLRVKVKKFYSQIDKDDA
jgi:RNA polymerase sigma factor (sigma-70 family)